jgi:hypothetical protein
LEAETVKSTVPNSSKGDGHDEDDTDAQIVEDVLQSLDKSVPQENVTQDASTSLAQGEALPDAGIDVTTSEVEPEKGDPEKIAEENVSEDVVVVKSVGTSQGGKTGVGRRLRERRGKETEFKVAAPKSVKKKKSEKTMSPKKKFVGPSRSSSKVEIPSQQKKKSSKRKLISLSDSDHDAAEDVPNITPSPKKRVLKKKKSVVSLDEDAEYDAPSITASKKRVGGRFIPPNVPDVPIDGVSFHFIDSVQKWKYVFARRIGLERELSADTLAWKEVIELLDQAGLMKTVSGLSNCYAKLVKEFIVNIAEDCDNPLSNDYQKVYVRNKCVEFSPIIINRFLGRQEDGYSAVDVTNNEVCKTITANQVKVWPSKGKVPSCMLSVKYAVLNRIGTVNWVPTTHTSPIATGLARLIYSVGTGTVADYGTYIFEQTMAHGKSWAVKMPIAFPSLICGIILDQYPNILTAADEPLKREAPLSLHFKLFEGAHAVDIAGPIKSKSAPRQIPPSNLTTRHDCLLGS